MRTATWTAIALICAAPALAQDAGDVFGEGANGAKIHAASGFACPLQLGYFQRDAVGERDPKSGLAYCAYSALDGVYGTIFLRALDGPYDPKAALAPDFVELEATGGRNLGEATQSFGAPGPQVKAFTRLYETSHLGDLHYRTLFVAGAVGTWAVQVTMEYASPRDDAIERGFVDAVFAQAARRFGGAH